MFWLKKIFAELAGLFIDDGLFASTIIGWILIIWLGTYLMLPAAWMPVVFFAGLAFILAESAIRRARQKS